MYHTLDMRGTGKTVTTRGEKPSVYSDFPISLSDYELIDLFNWQEEVKDMIFQIEFVKMIDVQSETVDRYNKDEIPKYTKKNLYKLWEFLFLFYKVIFLRLLAVDNKWMVI